MPAISVVMPTLNQRPFIGEAVRSIMSQEVDDVEVVVMDGGSTDGTQTELQALEAAFPGRLRWFSGPDDGPADAVHRGILEARAPLIGWLNSDDIYRPGAMRRALEHLSGHPEHVMVYGQGEHVDVHGRHLEVYPTLPPSTPIHVFADGCFICQPTAYFRRAPYIESGGLDNSLKAAFDFDLWMRLFKRHPRGIGFVDAMQASTRLHEGAITMRMRQRVALEGLQVVHRHLGAAPGHWLLTHLDEMCATHPFRADPMTLREAMSDLVQRASGWLAPGHADEVLRRTDADRRVQLSTAHVGVGVHADGWAGPTCELRLRADGPPVAAMRLTCANERRGGSLLRIRIHDPDGGVSGVDVDGPGRFELVVPVSPAQRREQAVWSIETEGGFVPIDLDPRSSDRRELAFRVLDFTVQPA
ncbi:MAG TPA: glycosyltransferase [Ideonella sp.]|uniref:glycosyltransferase n=1 Tax=Ideonella sp. TaxID=1929293 RepID=UPI002E2FA9BE|nr:glycosyltransferase [Ideonella sp.]HEX5686737.1 glycosyltransferase [Ideonella sp.]